MYATVTDVFGDTVKVFTGTHDDGLDDRVTLVVQDSRQPDKVEAEALLRPEVAADLGAQLTLAAVDAGASAPVDGWLGTEGTNARDISFNEGLIRLAAIHKREISFRYAKGDGTILETRTVIPSKVRAVEDHLTFTGHDVDRDDVRAYRLDRIRGDAWL